jgi:hypothetical protein
MTEATWPEIAMAGTLFAILTKPETAFETGADKFESIEIDHGTLRLAMKDGELFELTVKRVPGGSDSPQAPARRTIP